MPNDILLHTPRLTLGPLREQDQAALTALFRHEAVKQTYMVPDPLDDALAHNVAADAHQAAASVDGGTDDFSDFLK